MPEHPSPPRPGTFGLIAAALMAFLVIQATALAGNYDHPRWYNATHLSRGAHHLARLPHASSMSCARPYAAMYGDGALNLSVFFGFSELTESDIVVDPYNARAFLQQLRKPCSGGLAACGFRWTERPVSADAPFVLTRLLQGPSGPVRARIKLYDSAVDDELGRILTQLPEAQERKSARVQGHFLHALDQEDAVLYLGHSRLGTGPGFGAFEAFSSDWWQAMLFNPGRKAMADTLRERSDPLPMLGLFACDSRSHYHRSLHRASPETALILSDDITYVDDDSVRLFATLNAILARQCEPAVTTALQSDGDNATYHLPGWFEPIPPLPAKAPPPFPDLAWGAAD
ncbi:MAG: hypothetical protein ACPGUC_04070 [Gammaproteobacteria bacterium]